MKDADNLHLKVQELCSCFCATDPLTEMAAIPSDKNPDEAALKWLALGIMDSSIDLSVRIKDKKGARKISIEF